MVYYVETQKKFKFIVPGNSVKRKRIFQKERLEGILKLTIYILKFSYKNAEKKLS